MSKYIIILVKSCLGNFYRHLAIFSGHTAHHSLLPFDVLLPDQHVIEGETVLDDEQGDRDERDQHGLDQEDPFSLGRRRAELTDSVGDLMDCR